MELQEAASVGLRSMEHLIRLMSHQSQQTQPSNHFINCREITDLTLSNFKKAMSNFNRTGHARFRRGPVYPHPSSSLPAPDSQTLTLGPASSDQSHTQALTLDFTKSNLLSSDHPKSTEMVSASQLTKETTLSMSSTNSSTFMSSITGEGSVSNGKQRLSSSFFLAAPEPAVPAGKPPLSASHKRCRDDHSQNISGKTSGSSSYRCSKKRKSLKRTIRIPAVSSKIADIPSDDYSWRKYGQKPIKGSPYPRGYYKCSSVRGCPARKHVERATDDPTMLVVTYEGEHRHSQPAKEESVAPGLGGLLLEST